MSARRHVARAPRRRSSSPALLLSFALALPLTGFAHDARPLSVTILEQGSGFFRVLVRVPPSLEAANLPRIVWPAACDLTGTDSLRTTREVASSIHCSGGLAGQTLAIEYPLYNPSISTLVRLESASGATRMAVLAPDQPSWTVPVEPTALVVAGDYVVLGFAHIWNGPDHLMFVAGLMLLARGGRRILWAVTGFTLAHSLTLSLAALGLVRVPVEPIEALIALSILFLAGELARPDSTSISRRYPIALAFAFGLLHGLGFASALEQIGLPTTELATGLVSFNVGVELGQLAFIALVLAGLTALRRGGAKLPRRYVPSAPLATLVGAYVLGVPAAFWFIERSIVALAA